MVTGGIITWLIRLGDWIRDLTARGSKRAIAELMDFQSRSAWLLPTAVVSWRSRHRSSPPAIWCWSIRAR